MAAPVCRISPPPLHVILAPYVIPDLIRDPCPASPLVVRRVKGSGKPAVTDVPYFEANELVGGFFIIEAADKDEAVRVASLHPAETPGKSIGWGI